MTRALVVAMMVLAMHTAAAQGRNMNEQEMIRYENEHVAEPSARLSRCGRMDFAEHFINVYVDLFSSPQGMPAERLRERIFRLSYVQYDLLERAQWPDPARQALNVRPTPAWHWSASRGGTSIKCATRSDL